MRPGRACRTTPACSGRAARRRSTRGTGHLNALGSWPRAVSTKGRTGRRGGPGPGRPATATASTGKRPWPWEEPCTAPWKSGDLGSDPREELARQRTRLPAYLAPLARGEVLDLALPRAESLLEAFGESRLLERLRHLAGRIVARELSVLLPPRDGSQAPQAPVGVVTGAVDLVYRDPATGHLVIADYKTDEVEDPEELARRAAVYAPQGATYVRALQEALDLPQPPRFELWFLRADRVV